MDKQQSGSNDFWRKVDETRQGRYKINSSPLRHELSENYKWLKQYLLCAIIMGKSPFTFLDYKGHPIIQEIYAVRHPNLNKLNCIAEKANKRFEELHDASEKDIADDLILSKLNKDLEFLLHSSPYPVFYYKWNPENYFTLYDIPLLMYLNKRSEQSNRREITALNCPETYQPILDRKFSHLKKHSAFGISVSDQNSLNDGIKLIVPTFCEKGRLEAYKRFVIWGDKAEYVHMLKYFAFSSIHPKDFICAAKEAGHKWLTDDMLIDRIHMLIKDRISVDSYTSRWQSPTLYFYGCIPRENTLLERLKYASPLRQKSTDSLEKFQIAKIRNTNRHEEMFEVVHRTLYEDSTNDSGFIQPTIF